MIENACPTCKEVEFLQVPNKPDLYVCIYCYTTVPRSHFISDKPFNLYENIACSKCDKSWRITREGDKVCPDCGSVKRHFQLYDQVRSMSESAYRTYKRSFYFNERLSQYNGTEPEIHPRLRVLLCLAYQIACEEGIIEKGEKVPYVTTRKICRSVSLINEGQSKTKVFLTKRTSKRLGSKKFKKKPLKNLLYLAEKWVTLNRLWTGHMPPPFDFDLINSFRQSFSFYQRPFDIFRHTDECNNDKKNDKYHCHKGPYKCRYAIVNINLLISIFLLKAGVEEDSEEYLTIMEWWPQLNIEKRVKLVKRYIIPIEAYLHGEENKLKFIPKTILNSF